ncbi:MAG: corrinoid protein-associated methyltransferase CpaM [Gemmatimonadota bacterium]
MSTYILMRILESAPRRYDRGIRLLTLGRLEGAYDRLASHVQDGQRVLDIGCGTGALALRAARRGARVKGIDRNPEMLEIARERAFEAGLERRTEWAEVGVAELGEEEPESYDAVLSGLCFSELSEDELRYALDQASRLLAPGGLLLVVDEARPRGRWRRAWHRLLRAPLVAVTYLLTQQTTRPVADLPGRVRRAGLLPVSVRSGSRGGLIELVARKPTAGEG